jgi:hypothetical protein
LNHVLGVAADAVLGPKEQAQIDVRVGVHEIGCVGELTINRGVIGHQADAGLA